MSSFAIKNDGCWMEPVQNWMVIFVCKLSVLTVNGVWLHEYIFNGWSDVLRHMHIHMYGMYVTQEEPI